MEEWLSLVQQGFRMQGLFFTPAFLRKRDKECHEGGARSLSKQEEWQPPSPFLVIPSPEIKED